MVSPHQNRKLVDLNSEQYNMVEFDLPNLDDQADSSGMNSLNLDDPFDDLLAPQVDITEAEFFDLVNQHPVAEDQRLNELPDYAAEVDSAWETDEPEDFTAILSPSQLLAKLKAEQEAEPEPQEEDWQESAPLGNHFSFGTAELDWHDVTVGEVSEPESESYTSFFDPAAMASLESPQPNSPAPPDMNNSFNFEDREDLEEEILFTTSIANSLPDLLEQPLSEPIDHTADEPMDAQDLPDLNYLSNDSAVAADLNYFEGFDQDFPNASEPDVEELPPLPPLPRVLPAATNISFNPPTQNPPSQPKSVVDPQEQDWLDSFDQMAESMEWEIGDTGMNVNRAPKESVKTPVKTKEENTACIPSPSVSPQPSQVKSASKNADLFNIPENDSMDWTALLDADTGFIQEIESIHAQKQPGNFAPPQPAPQLSPLSGSEARQIDAVPAKAQFKFDLDKYRKPLILAGSAIAAIGFMLITAPAIGRFALITGLKLGWLKNAEAQDLKKVDLSRGNLAGVNLSKADLRQANLAGANLTGANLMNADLRGTNLKSANLRGANLRGSKLELSKGKNPTQVPPRFLLMWQIVNQPRVGRSLPGANLDGFNLNSANLRNANLSGSRLTWVNFDNANLGGADLSGADLNGANFNRANLSGAVFFGAKWSKSQAPRTNATTTCPNGRKGPCTLVR